MGRSVKSSLPNAANSMAHPGKDKKKDVFEYLNDKKKSGFNLEGNVAALSKLKDKQ